MTPRFLAVLGFAALLAAPTLPAQLPPPPGRVLLFGEPNYRGEALVLPAGASLDNLEYVRDSRGRKWNDRIASVRIEGPVVLVAFEHSRFRGAQTTITRSSADLITLSLGDRGSSNWDQRISSVRAEPVRPAAPVVIVWTRYDAERAIRSAYRDMLGRDPDEPGMRAYRVRLMERGWSEDQLRDDLRRSPEFRNRDLDALIRRVYRELFGRDPDQSGFATYNRRLRDGMSEAEFRADLRRSREFSEYTARVSVTRAYREVLRRDPDPGGLDNYVRLMLERGWDEGRVREALRQSEEFRHLPRR